MDVFTITIIFILLSAIIAIIIRKVQKDKCLKDLRDDMITLEHKTGEETKGVLKVRNTGLEFKYKEKMADDSGYNLLSYLLYKSEYTSIQALIRYHDELTEEGRKEREKELKKTFNPSRLSKSWRQIKNFFKTIKDSLMEILNLVTHQMSRTSPTGMVLASQNKYISRVQNDLAGTIETSFEPLLEHYIGYQVILEVFRGEKVEKYQGVLKEYSPEFIELINVKYNNRVADMVVSRKYGIVRNLSD
ncbi:MAG: hypothetical protein ACOCQ1_01990 [Halanaerobiaceae bacterium]